MAKLNARAIIPLILLLAICGTWYFWMSRNASSDQRLEKKAKEAIRQAIEETQWEVERTKMIIPNSMPFYAAKLEEHEDLAGQKLLYRINADSSLPPIKLKRFSIHSGMSMDIRAIFEYPGLLGLARTVEIHTNQQWIPFKSATGTETYSSESASTDGSSNGH